MRADIGQVCVCRRGRTGVVTKIIHMVDKPTMRKVAIYKGIGFDGKPWQTEYPKILASNIEEYIGKTHGD